MKYEFKLPDVGEGMHEGEIVRFLVNEGDTVQVDQPIIEVQTDKVTVELPSPKAGKVTQFPVSAGDTVAVGAVVAVIDTEEGTKQEMNETGHYAKEVTLPSNSYAANAQANPLRRVIAAPHTRRIARQLGIDIEQVKGTGKAGRVTEEDLRNFTQQPAQPNRPKSPSPESTSSHSSIDIPPERIPMRGLRKKIAEKMVRSKFTIPHVTSFDDIDITALVNLRTQMKPLAESRGMKLTFMPFFIKALVVALKDYPVFNAFLDEQAGEIVLHRQYHIGIATDTEEGLIVPVIHNADQKSIFQLAVEVYDLAEKARNRKLSSQEVSGGTFTISNVGPVGGLYATPIVNHPEVAILATHKIEKKPVVREDEIVIRQMMNFSLSFDHRVADGVTAVKFTNRFKQLLEQPEALFMELH